MPSTSVGACFHGQRSCRPMMSPTGDNRRTCMRMDVQHVSPLVGKGCRDGCTQATTGSVHDELTPVGVGTPPPTPRRVVSRPANRQRTTETSVRMTADGRNVQAGRGRQQLGKRAHQKKGEAPQPPRRTTAGSSRTPPHPPLPACSVRLALPPLVNHTDDTGTCATSERSRHRLLRRASAPRRPETRRRWVRTSASVRTPPRSLCTERRRRRRRGVCPETGPHPPQNPPPPLLPTPFPKKPPPRQRG